MMYSKLLEAYAGLVKLSQLGYNVSGFVDEFNGILSYGNVNEAEANAMLQSLLNQIDAALAHQMAYITTVVAALTVLIVTSAYLAYRYRGSLRKFILRLIYRVFIRPRLDSPVEGGGGRDEAFVGILIGIFIVLAVFAFMSVEIPNYVQFEAIGLLTSGGFSNYPTSVAVGQNVTLYVFVYSHRSSPTWYVVNMYINGTLTGSVQRVLLMGGNYTFPVTLSFNRAGTYNFTAALYVVNTDGSLVYTGRFVRLTISAAGR